MVIDLTEIERLAKAATPGEYIHEGTHVWVLEHAGWHKGKELQRNRITISVTKGPDTGSVEAEATARMIAHMHPDRVLELVGMAGDYAELDNARRICFVARRKAENELAEALARIATLESDLRDIGAALCTSDGILIPNELTNLERIESLHRVLGIAFERMHSAEAGLEAAADRIHKMSREHAEERRTANEALAAEYDARKKAEGRIYELIEQMQAAEKERAQLLHSIEHLTAERDAALARIEKVREVLEEPCLCCMASSEEYGMFNARKVDRAIAALEAKP